MAFQGYLYIEGESQGTIECIDLDSDLHEGSIPFYHFSHDIRIPSEFGVQNMSSKPLHGPVVITKNVDMTTPSLYRAFLSGEKLTVELRWYQIIDGEEELIYTITLKGARIVSMDSLKHDVRDGDFESYGVTEKVGFAYNMVEWDHETDEGDAVFEFDTTVDYKQGRVDGGDTDSEAPAKH